VLGYVDGIFLCHDTMEPQPVDERLAFHLKVGRIVTVIILAKFNDGTKVDVT
jgi:hypothetical protein